MDGVYVMVMIGYFSRRIKLEVGEFVDGVHAMKGLEGWLQSHGNITQRGNDGGEAFANVKVKARLDKRGIGHASLFPNDHRSNGLTKRWNCIVWQSIRKCWLERKEVS